MHVLFYIADGDRVWPGENYVFSLLVTTQSSAASSWSGRRRLNRPRCPKTKMASPLTLSLPFLFPSYFVASRHSVGESDPRFWGCRDGLRWRKRAFITSTFPVWWKGWTKMASDSWLNLKFLFTFISVKFPLQHLCRHLFSTAASVFALYLSAACQGSASEFIRCKVYALHTAANWCELQ